MNLTKHGQDRIRKRIGINKKSIGGMTDKAFQSGIEHKQTTGRLNKYFSHLYFKERKANNIRIYSNYVWIFYNKTLITVFPIPKEHLDACNKLFKINERSLKEK